MKKSSMRLRRIASLFASMIVLTVSTGCMQQPASGGFSKDDQVSHAFRSGTVPTDLTYYYTGRDSMPYAIMGITPSYTVPSKYWITFEPEQKRLRNMSSNIYGNDRFNPYGFNILAPDGTPVGIWYSNLRYPNVRVDQENRTVIVLYRNPESYDDF